MVLLRIRNVCASFGGLRLCLRLRSVPLSMKWGRPGRSCDRSHGSAALREPMARLTSYFFALKSRLVPKWRNWQTRYVQGVVRVPSCGFKSHLRHQANNLLKRQVVFFSSTAPPGLSRARTKGLPRRTAEAADSRSDWRLIAHRRAVARAPVAQREGTPAPCPLARSCGLWRGIIDLFEAIASFNGTRSRKTQDFVSFYVRHQGLTWPLAAFSK